jgi:hypothetical protein
VVCSRVLRAVGSPFGGYHRPRSAAATRASRPSKSGGIACVSAWIWSTPARCGYGRFPRRRQRAARQGLQGQERGPAGTRIAPDVVALVAELPPKSGKPPRNWATGSRALRPATANGWRDRTGVGAFRIVCRFTSLRHSSAKEWKPSGIIGVGIRSGTRRTTAAQGGLFRFFRSPRARRNTWRGS